MSNAVYDLRRTRSLPSANQVLANDNERGSERSPIANLECVEYASDSSCEDYREFHKQQLERKTSSPIGVASSAFTIDNILGRNEKRDRTPRTNGAGNGEENNGEDEGNDKVERHFVGPAMPVMPAARSGM